MINVIDLQHILDHVDFSQLKDKSVFITGGTGFVGKWVVESLVYVNEKLKLNIKITVLTRDIIKACKNNWVNVGLLEGDVRDFKVHYNYDYVLHMASDDGHRLTTNNPLQMFEIITKGTWNALEQFRDSKILFLSSGKVDDREDNAYVQGKRTAEYLCNLYHKQYGMDIKIARGYSFVGAYLPLDSHFAIGNFIGNALRNEPIRVKSNGMTIRSYLYMADTVIWLWKILLEGNPCEPYDVGSYRLISIGELARKISKVANQDVIMGDVADYGGYYPIGIKNELGLKQYISLNEGIKRTIEWCKLDNSP